MKVKFNVREDLHQWGCDSGVFLSAENPHEVDASKAFAEQIASAEAFGSLVDVLGAPKGVVEDDKVSLKKQEAAMKSGDWQKGNVLQAELDVIARQNEEDGA